MPNQSFTIDVTAVLAVLHFAAKNDRGPALRGVCIEYTPDGAGAIAVASDGHALAAWCEKRPDDSAASIVIAPQGHIVKAMRQKKARLLCFNGTTLRVYDEKGSQLASQSNGAIIDADFPDWRRVFPPQVRPGAICPVDPKYLALFEKTSKVAGKWTNGLFTFSTGKSDDPRDFDTVVCRLANCDNFVAAIGSIKYDAPFPLPEWMV